MDLANDLGNLLSRTTAMADKYFGGNLPAEQAEGPEDAALLEKANALRARYETDMEAYAFQNALADVFDVIDNANKYIDATAPWVLAKSEESKPRLARVLYNLAETLRICTVLLQPFMPATCEKIFAQLNVDAVGKTWDSAAAFGTLPAAATLHKGENIFPRIDAAKELAELEALEAAQKAAAQAANAPAEEEKPAESAAASAELIGDHEEEISFDDFCKVELRVAEVRACERMKESKKLLHLTVFDGERERCILSGIAKWFAPEDLIGKKIGIVANLAPPPDDEGQVCQRGYDFLPPIPTPRAAAPSLSSRTARPRAHASTKAEGNSVIMQKSRLDQFFSIPAAAVLMAIICNVLWGSAFPFIKMGYRLFAIDSSDTASILCFAGVRFMMGAALVWLAGLVLNRRPLPMPRGKTLASACGLGLWQTAAQYFFYYSAVALLTGAMGGILNSTQSFMGVILAHFLYGKADRMTPAQGTGLRAGLWRRAGGYPPGNHGSGSVKGMAFMLIASAVFALAGPWNKAVTQHADSFSVCVLNLGIGGLALAVLGFAMGGSLHPQSAAGVLRCCSSLRLSPARATCCGHC